MKINIIKIIGLVFLGLISTGCLEDAFQKGGSVTSDRLDEMDDATVLEAIIKGIPASMMSANAGGYAGSYGYHADFGISAIHLMTEHMLEDMTIGGNLGYSWFNGFLTNLSMGPEYVTTGYIWQCYYVWIGAANNAIGMVGEVTDETDDAVRNYLGQAYTYRAMCYLDLARLYEPKANRYLNADEEALAEGWSVPIVTEATSDEDKKNNPRRSREEMYDFILSDLQMAEDLLDPTVNVYSLPTLGAVYGLYARAYIEMAAASNEKKYYRMAAEYADLAVKTSGRTPLTESQWHDSMNGFNNGSSNNSWIWGLTSSSENLAPVISTVAHLSAEAIWAYGILALPSISKATYERISDNDFRKWSWLGEDPTTWKTDPNYRYAGSDEPLTGNESYGIYNVADYFLYSAKPYVSLKFRPMGGACMDYTNGGAADHMLMRVEEMYFIKMEATLHTEGLDAAKKLLDEFMSYRWSGQRYDCSGIISKESFIQEMLFQKRVEFWGEGILFYDYKRLDQGIIRGYSGTNFPSSARFNVEGRSPQWNLVIPRTEYLHNKGIDEGRINPDPTGKLPEWTE